MANIFMQINSHNLSKGKEILSFLDGNVYDYDMKENNDVLLTRLYREIGDEFIRKLRGDFAIAIIDPKEQKILLARDQAGHKHVFYSLTPSGIEFAFDIESLLKKVPHKRKINQKALNYYLDFRFVPAPETFFEGIYEVQPGYVLIYKDGKIQTRPYWERRYNTGKRKPEEYYADGLFEAMDEAVRVRLEGEGPIGGFLSGGLDSSTLIGLMAKAGKRPVKTFTAGFGESDFNEIPDAKLVADYFGVEHQHVIITPQDVIDFIPKLVQFTGQPFYDSTAIATYFAAELARKEVATVLDAHGPDQQLASFTDYIIPLGLRLKNISVKDFAEKLILQKTLFKNGLKERLFSLSPALAGDVTGLVYNELDKVKDRSVLEKLLFWDCQHSVPDYFMVKLESMTRPHGLDVRNPFLDVRLMDFICTIPADLKLRIVYNPVKKYLMKEKPISRYIMKKAMESLLPQDTLKKKKQHFSVPLKYWMKNQLKDYTRDTLLSQKSLSRPIWQGPAVKDIINDFYSGNQSNTHYGVIWTLLLLELWQETFIDNGGVKA